MLGRMHRAAVRVVVTALLAVAAVGSLIHFAVAHASHVRGDAGVGYQASSVVGQGEYGHSHDQSDPQLPDHSEDHTSADHYHDSASELPARWPVFRAMRRDWRAAALLCVHLSCRVRLDRPPRSEAA